MKNKYLTWDDVAYFVKKYEDKYPMTGKLDSEAAYKNGWYDCAYSIRKSIEEESKMKPCMGVVKVIIDGDSSERATELYKMLKEFCDATKIRDGVHEIWIKDADFVEGGE